MQNNVSPKKSLGFLSIVAFFMMIILMGYFFPALNVHAKGNTSEEQDTPSQEETMFAHFEKTVADTTIEVLDNMFHFTTNDDILSGLRNEEVAEFSPKEMTGQILGLLEQDRIPLQFPYSDIEDSPFRQEILIVYSNQLFADNPTFQPKNYVRISDFVRVVMDTYRLKKQLDPSTLKGLTDKNYFSTSTLPMTVMMRINSAYELGLFQNLDVGNLQEDAWLKQFISPKQALQILGDLQKKNAGIVTVPQLKYTSSEVLLKEELAKLLVEAFELELDTTHLPIFKDIGGTTYQDDIQTLADLGIVDKKEKNFSPEEHVTNEDFVTLAMRSLIAKTDDPISIPDFYYLNHLQNVSTLSTYAPYLEYCLNSQICNSLLSQGSSGVSFEADRTLTWGEIENVLSDLSQFKFTVPESRGKEPMTRGELAHLLVTTFGLDEIDEKNAEEILSPTTILNTDLSSDPSTEDASSWWLEFRKMMTVS